MLKKHAILFLVAVVFITPVSVLAIVHWMEKKWTALPILKDELFTTNGFRLTNLNGQTVTPEQWKGKLVVANFFFTHCPLVCPKMTLTLKKVEAAFAGEKALLFNSFSVDPERDSVPQLRSFAERFGITQNWHLLTGEKEVIYHLARKDFALVATDGDGGEHDFIHSEKLVLLDKQQRIRGYYNGTSPTAAQELIQDIKKLQDEK